MIVTDWDGRKKKQCLRVLLTYHELKISLSARHFIKSSPRFWTQLIQLNIPSRWTGMYSFKKIELLWERNLHAFNNRIFTTSLIESIVSDFFFTLHGWYYIVNFLALNGMEWMNEWMNLWMNELKWRGFMCAPVLLTEKNLLTELFLCFNNILLFRKGIQINKNKAI